MSKTHGGFIDTEVVADIVTGGIPKNLKFTALADVDNTLKGSAGSTIKFPVYDYIGDAEDTLPGGEVEISAITSKSNTVVVKKATKGVSVYDEDVLNAVGKPIEETASQITLSLAGKVDTDLKDELEKGELESETVDSVATLQAAVDKFLDDEEEDYVIYLNPVDASSLRTDAGQNYLAGSELGAERFATGVVGEVNGVQVLRSNKVEVGNFYLVKRGALKLVIKREAVIEEERESKFGRTDIIGNIHYAPHLQRPNHVVKAANL